MVGNEYAYGYGWWVSPVDYYAMGRGGQFIHIIPSLNTVVVITGGEYDSGPVDAFLIKSLLGSNRKLAADPAGMAELDAVLAASLQGPSREIAPAPMDTIQMVSGKDYRCASNPVGLTAIRLVFDTPETASLDLVLRGQELSWPVGLDGSYRMSPDGQGTRGYWQDAQTFALEIFDVGQLTRLLHFEGAGLELTIPEAELTIECEMQAP